MTGVQTCALPISPDPQAVANHRAMDHLRPAVVAPASPVANFWALSDAPMPWTNLSYRAVDLCDTRYGDYISALRALYNKGDVILRAFEPIDCRAFDEAARTAPLGHDFLASFLNAEAVQKAVLGSSLVKMPPISKYHWYSPFEMEGGLTAQLLKGGAYKQFTGTTDDARRLSRDFTEAIGHDWTQVFKIITGEWLELTFVAYNQVQRRLWFLYMNDSD